MNNLSSKQQTSNSFLLAVTSIAIEYLEHPHTELYSRFKALCNSNKAYDCWENPYNTAVALEKYHKEMFEKTRSLLDLLIFFSEYVGCECHNKSLKEYNSEVQNALKEYIRSLLFLWNIKNFQTQLNSMVSEFREDYNSIFKRLENQCITIKSAEQELSIWCDVVPDEILENAVLSFRFTYVTKLLMGL